MCLVCVFLCVQTSNISVPVFLSFYLVFRKEENKCEMAYIKRPDNREQEREEDD